MIKTLTETFEPDLIFPLMDLTVEANALGEYTLFPQDAFPTVMKANSSIEQLISSMQVDIAFDTRILGYVETLKMMSVGLSPTILKGAYVTGPYTLVTQLLGADRAAITTISDPDTLTLLCSLALEKIQSYIRMLLASGAQVLCILEPSAVMLGADEFERFSAQYVRKINNSCRDTGVTTVYHICGNSMHLIDKMVESGVGALSLDSPQAGVDLPAVAEKASSDIVLIGNINPTGSMLKGNPVDVAAEVADLLKSMESYPNFVLSTGCDLPRETPVENIYAFMHEGRREHPGNYTTCYSDAIPTTV